MPVPKRKICIILAFTLLAVLCLHFVPISGPFISKFLGSKVKERFGGKTTFKSASVVPLRHFRAKGLKYIPKKHGIPFSAEEVIISYNGLKNLMNMTGDQYKVTVRGFAIETNGENAFSNFSGIFKKDNDGRTIIFKDAVINSRKLDGDTIQNTITADGDQVSLKGQGIENKNGNIISYKFKIYLKNEAKKGFSNIFLMGQSDNGQPLEVDLSVQGHTSNPFITVSTQNLKLNFRLVKPDATNN